MKNNKRKRAKRLYIIFGIIFLFFLVLGLSLNTILSNIAQKRVISLLNKNPERLYDMKFDDLNINVFTGSMSLKQIEMIPTDSAKNLLRQAFLPALMDIQIPRIRISGISIFRYVRKNEIKIRNLIIRNVEVKYFTNTTSEKKDNNAKKPLSESFPDALSRVYIKSIRLKNTSFEAIQVDKSDKPFFAIDSVNLRLDRIITDKEIFKQAIPFDIDDIQLSTGHFDFTPMKFYNLYSRDMNVSIKDRQIRIDGFRLIPKYTKEEYNKIIQYNNDWFSINTHQIVISGFDLEDIVANNKFNLSSIEILKPDISIYRDKRLPDAPFKYKPLLAGMIHKIPVAVTIDTIRVSDGYLQYEEQVEVHHEPGKVFFDPLFLSVYNVTNDVGIKSVNPEMAIDFRGKIMAESFLDANISIDLNSPDEAFSIYGTLEPTDGTIFNSMIERLMPAKVHSGNITKTEFSFDANDDVSTGKLILEFTDLKIDVTKAKKEFEEESGFLSVVANAVVRNHNTLDKGKYITGEINFNRRKDKAIVNFLWNSVKTGVISVVAPIAAKSEERKKKKNKD